MELNYKTGEAEPWKLSLKAGEYQTLVFTAGWQLCQLALGSQPANNLTIDSLTKIAEGNVGVGGARLAFAAGESVDGLVTLLHNYNDYIQAVEGGLMVLGVSVRQIASARLSLQHGRQAGRLAEKISTEKAFFDLVSGSGLSDTD